MTTKQGQSKKDEIIRAGAELIHAKGFTATGLQEILDSASVPKGSFYFYFKSKEDFGLAIIDYFASFLGVMFSTILADRSLPPLLRLDRLINTYESFFRKKGYARGCPVGNLSLEMADLNERMRKRLEAVIDELVGHIERCLQDGIRDGSLPPRFDAAGTARFIFHGFEGAVLHMKVTRSIEPIRTFRVHIFDYLHRLQHDAG